MHCYFRKKIYRMVGLFFITEPKLMSLESVFGCVLYWSLCKPLFRERFHTVIHFESTTEIKPQAHYTMTKIISSALDRGQIDRVTTKERAKAKPAWGRANSRWQKFDVDLWPWFANLTSTAMAHSPIHMRKMKAVEICWFSRHKQTDTADCNT